MNGWLRAAGVGESSAVETTPLSQEGSTEQELETKKGMENECLRGRMKFRVCVSKAQGAVGQTT